MPKTEWPEIEVAREENRRELILSGDSIRERLEKEEEVPAEIFSLADLNFLEISGVNLSNVSGNIGKLLSLTRIVLRHNSLTVIPPEMGQLGKLKHLDLSENQLVELPDTLSNLSSLQHINVSSNQLETLPNFSEAVNLVEVIAAHNRIKEFPEWLLTGEDAFIYLNSVNFRGNEISELPNAISQISASVRTLNLAENKLLEVPGELGTCARLKELLLFQNPLKDRRLLKLINEDHTKMHAVLEYIRKNCSRATADNASRKNKKKKKGGKRTESEGDGECERNSLGQIIVSPSSPETQILISPEAAAIRPHLVCCVVKGLDLAKENALKSFLQIQNKLHDSEKGCNRRVACTIATHDLARVKFPLTLKAKKPEEIRITPLRSGKELTGEELVGKLTEEAEALRKKEKRNTYLGVHKYLYLLKDLESYACFEDAQGTVISFPPITNSNVTKMSSDTEDLLLEITGSQDQAICKRVADTLLTEMLELGLGSDAEDSRKQLFIKQVKVVNDSGKVHVTYPDKNDLKLPDVEVSRTWENQSK